MTNQLNRSFSRRIGKSLSKIQKEILEESLSEYLLSPDEIKTDSTQGIIAEIGIGMGEHIINLCLANPHILHIGFDPYLNGIANTLLLRKKYNIDNLRLWPDDIDLVFLKLPDESIQKLYILFPDPWPKNKQKKRRIVCSERLKLFAQKMQCKGEFYFVSDIKDYADFVTKLFFTTNFFVIEKNEQNTPHLHYVKTKYHQKAEKEGRVASFIKAIKN